MRHPLHIIIICILAIGFVGCKKKWKKPAPVSVNFMAERFEGNGNQTAAPESLTFKNGYLRIVNFQILGDREQADGIDFKNSDTYLYNFNANSELSYNFDIPQGTYTQLDVIMELGNNDNDPSIKLDAVWTDVNQVETNVQFRYNPRDVFRAMAKENDGTNEIVLVKDESRTMVVKIDLESWFAGISSTMWENADHVGGSQNSPVKIDEDNNTDLYNSIVSRIADGVMVTFQ